MSKVVLASFRADTPADAETVKRANESARRHNNEPPFPSGTGVTSVPWFLVADTDTGQVTATRDPGEVFGTDEGQSGGSDQS